MTDESARMSQVEHLRTARLTENLDAAPAIHLDPCRGRGGLGRLGRDMSTRGGFALPCAVWVALSAGCGTPASEPAAGLDAGESLDAGADASTVPVCEGEVARRFDPVECPRRLVMIALDEERGMWMASRLTLPAGTRHLSNIGYALAPARDSGEFRRCNDGIAHRVHVFSAPAAEAPPATPELLTDPIEVPSTPPTGSMRPFLHTLPTPVAVPEGHDVFVSFEMVRTSEMLCVLACASDGFGEDTFWSNTFNPPYMWAPLASFGAEFGVEVTLCVGHD
ncbi:MAG: hypothetical protein KF729_22760 [Sandaracinaceae bacterium]|nr:hypothetical protein [Sandaracinaceae bacterium]